MTKTMYSVAVPLYNEEKNIAELYRRLTAVMRRLEGGYEVVIANDGSTDATLEKLREICRGDKHIKIVSLSRNFGHEAAVTAALGHTRGERVILMDGDLQDAPEFIPVLLEKLAQGYDVVYAEHPRRKDPWYQQFFYRGFYLLMGKLASYPIPTHVGAFSVMRRPVVAVLSSMQEQNRFVAGLRAWAGFRQAGVEYEKQARYAGRAPQTFRRHLKMALDALFSFSYVPLRAATYLGLSASAASFIIIADVLYAKLVAGTAILGWASPLVSTLFLGGVQLIILGIIGEYLGRIYDEVKRRPYYIVAEKIGF